MCIIIVIEKMKSYLNIKVFDIGKGFGEESINKRGIGLVNCE